MAIFTEQFQLILLVLLINTLNIIGQFKIFTKYIHITTTMKIAKPDDIPIKLKHHSRPKKKTHHSFDKKKPILRRFHHLQPSTFTRPPTRSSTQTHPPAGPILNKHPEDEDRRFADPCEDGADDLWRSNGLARVTLSARPVWGPGPRPRAPPRWGPTPESAGVCWTWLCGCSKCNKRLLCGSIASFGVFLFLCDASKVVVLSVFRFRFCFGWMMSIFCV